MKNKLSLNFLELSKILTNKNDPFNLLKIVNSLPEQGNWSFFFSSNNHQKTSLKIKTDLTEVDEEKIINCFDGSIPELINTLIAVLGDSTTGKPCRLKLVFRRHPTPENNLNDSINS